MTTIAIDVMSGDNGIVPPVKAALQIKKETPEVGIILVGDAAQIKDALQKDLALFSVEACDEVVAMDEPPARAIRKRGSSMRRALQLVAEGRADAAVSAGNTGALMGLGVLVLKVIDGISRPAIASFMPCSYGTDSCCIVDLGANVEATPVMLRDFALMGSQVSRVVKDLPAPRVGLLNVGEESFKGGKTLNEAAALLAQTPDINFIGNIEGHDIFHGKADVVVCDGFTGNAVLKATEGVARMIAGMVKRAFAEDALSRLCGLLAYPVIARIRRRLNPRAYNGGFFVGLRGVLVKSHGDADEKAFSSAIRYAVRAAGHDLANEIMRHTAPAPAAGQDADG